MDNLPKNKRRKWNPNHKSLEVLDFLRKNPPLSDFFECGSEWTDPPLCMPQFYKDFAAKNELDVVAAYRLLYAGTKVQITGISWLPFVEDPHWLENAKKIVAESKFLSQNLELEKAAQKPKKKRARIEQ